MTNGSFNNQKHVYDIPVEIKTISKKGVKEVKKADNTNQIVIQNRYSVMSSKLYHTNLAVIHYSVFFQTCRALGIGYDIQVIIVIFIEN
jgi:IQ domain-containing protein H